MNPVTHNSQETVKKNKTFPLDSLVDMTDMIYSKNNYYLNLKTFPPFGNWTWKSSN